MVQRFANKNKTTSLHMENQTTVFYSLDITTQVREKPKDLSLTDRKMPYLSSTPRSGIEDNENASAVVNMNVNHFAKALGPRCWRSWLWTNRRNPVSTRCPTPPPSQSDHGNPEPPWPRPPSPDPEQLPDAGIGARTTPNPTTSGPCQCNSSESSALKTSAMVQHGDPRTSV